VTGNLASETLARQTADQNLQNQINAEATTRANVDNTKADKATTLAGYGITNAYTKTEVNDLVDTPHQNYVTVQTYSDLPATGSADTIYRVSSYDGSVPEVNVTKYSEYAWSASLSQYIFLCVKSQIDEVFDITVYHSNTTYSDLASALGTDGDNIPPTLRRGGMSVKYVQSSDNKYVQYRLMSGSFNTTVGNWQGVDVEPTAGSENLVKSGGVAKKLAQLEQKVDSYKEISLVFGTTWNIIHYPVEIGESIILSNISESGNITGFRFYNENQDIIETISLNVSPGDYNSIENNNEYNAAFIGVSGSCDKVSVIIPTDLKTTVTELKSAVDENSKEIQISRVELEGNIVQKNSMGWSDKLDCPIYSSGEYVITNLNRSLCVIGSIRIYKGEEYTDIQYVNIFPDGNSYSIFLDGDVTALCLYFNGTNGVASVVKQSSLKEGVDNNYNGINSLYKSIDPYVTYEKEVYHIQNHSWVTNNDYDTLRFNVQSGQIVRLRNTGGTSTFGYIFISIDGTIISENGILSSEIFVNVPSGAVNMCVSCIRGNNNKKIEIRNSDVNSTKIEQISENISIPIKQVDDCLVSATDDYFAWFSGVIFNGYEYHIGTCRNNHTGVGDYDGNVILVEIDANGNRRTIVPNITQHQGYKPGQVGAGVTRDGQYMLVGVAYQDDSQELDYRTYEDIIVFNKTLSIVKTITLVNNGVGDVGLMFGNILETPEHYIIFTSYYLDNGVDTLGLWCSDEKITDTLDLHFTKVKTFDNYGSGLNEATVGYVGNKLVLVSRVHSANSVLYQTEDLNGKTGWSNRYVLNEVIHAPVMLPIAQNNIFAFGGCIAVGDPGQGGYRYPAIIYYNIDTHEELSVSRIDNGEIQGWGGYPSMVQISDCVFAMMYYDDYSNNKTTVFYQRVNARYKCNINYSIQQTY